jgi:ubiquinone biosynthesis protein
LRPGIEEKFARDIDFFLWGAEWLESLYPPMRRLAPVQVVETFRKSAATEMDLRLEAAAASELAENFERDTTFQVPNVDWSRTQRRVLTTDRIGGIPIADQSALTSAGRNLQQIARNLILGFLKQAFRDGFFHADLHQGNLFVDDHDNIVAVDFGIMGRLDRRTRLYVAEMLLAFLVGDYRRAAEVHFEAGYVPRDQSVDSFAQACRSIAEPIFDRPPAEVSMAKLFTQLFSITESFNMRTQPQLLLLQKTMVVVEGICRDLAPDADQWAIAREFLDEWVPENLGPMAKAKEAITEVADAARKLPGLVEKAELAALALAPKGLFPENDGDAAQVFGHRESARRMSTNKILYGVILVLVIVVVTQLF